MASTISTLFNLTRSDLGRQKSRLTVAAGLYGAAAIFFFLSLIFAGASLSIWMAETYGLAPALIFTSAICLSVSAIAVIANAIYQRRQKRRLARSAAVKGAAAATFLTVAKQRAGLAPIALAVVGYVLATRLGTTEEEA